jgi:hypothetical protein
MAQLRWLDRSTGPVIRRIQTAQCGELVHIDVKKLGKIFAGGGWRMLGRAIGQYNSQAAKAAVNATATATRSAAITSCTPRSTRTPGWPTPNYWPPSVRRQQQRFGCALTPGSMNAELPYGKC